MHDTAYIKRGSLAFHYINQRYIMGLFKKVFRPVRKIAKKIIPKEIRPFLPYIAAAIPGAQGLASLNAFMTPTIQKALLAGATSAATDEQGDPLRAAALAAAPDVLSKGLGAVGTKLGVPSGVDVEGTMTFAERIGEGARSAQGAIGRTSPLKIAAAQTAIDQSAKFAEIRQDEIDENNRSLQEQGVLDKTKRRTAIFNIYKNAGYDDDYVNSMLDRYGYKSGGRIGFANGGYRGKAEKAMGLMTMKDLLKGKTKAPIIEIDEDEEIEFNEKGQPSKIRGRKKDPDYAKAMSDAMRGVETAFGIPFSGAAPAEFKRFAKGGEVEEEVEESGIMIASSPNNFAELNMLAIDLFGRPYDQLTDGEQETLMDFIGSKSQAGGEGIMQMASGYKTDIEEMYEQYVFEMEEMGLEPMSFSQFLARERAGMADGGEVSIGQIEMLIKRGADNDLIKEYTGAADGVIDQIREAMKKRQNKKDGGEAQRRKKGEPADEVIETEEEIFIDNMPRPKRQGIMEAADGGIMEKDMRGGGFIPEGSKERADDVPARLSKNEFVMTADAVRAAGGGSVNKGAKRMYDMMYSLEGKI